MMPKTYFLVRFIVVTSFLIGFQSCVSPLGDPVREDFDSYYYSPDGKDILYCSNAEFWDLVDVIKMDADVNTFEVISPGFAKDKNNLFYGSKVVNDSIIDKDSFFTRNNHPYILGIGFDKNGVYVFSGEGVPRKIEQADPDTYEVVTYGRAWAKDASFYFYEDRCVDVDYTSFKILNLHFSVDSTSAYFNIEDQFYPIDADAATFKEMSFNPHTNTYSCSYDKDYLYYYIRHGYQGEYADKMIKTQYQDVSTIKVISDYLRIDDALFYGGKEIKGIDTDSIEIGGDYLKSNNLVFYEGKRVKGIDVGSARFIDEYGEYIKDKRSLFYKGKKVKQIDVERVEFISRDYVKDKKHVFYNGNIIPKADGATFQLTEEQGYIDKNYSYYQGEIHAVIDSITGKIKYDWE
ncbi:DKNYY domain-containing protein [uncultured Aquimarina sp.]|uniref:DKNYY domain-containing protein n=1 Tax=uncultured Aquimarina sp. TaxID=575652 RepID=UPI0026332CD1|nr:DKNYY domain-containing protein [uncultured Aquimarina sp.]